MGKRLFSLFFICTLILFTSCRSMQGKGGGGDGPSGGGGGKPKGGEPQAKQDRDGNGVNDRDEGNGPAPFGPDQSGQPAQAGNGSPFAPSTPGLDVQSTVPNGAVNPSVGGDLSAITGSPAHAGPVDTQPSGQRPPSRPGLEAPTTAAVDPSPTPSPQARSSFTGSGLFQQVAERLQQGVEILTSPFSRR